MKLEMYCDWSGKGKAVGIFVLDLTNGEAFYQRYESDYKQSPWGELEALQHCVALAKEVKPSECTIYTDQETIANYARGHNVNFKKRPYREAVHSTVQGALELGCVIEHSKSHSGIAFNQACDIIARKVDSNATVEDKLSDYDKLQKVLPKYIKPQRTMWDVFKAEVVTMFTNFSHTLINI